MDTAGRVIALFEGRGQLDRLDAADADPARACLSRAKERLSAASVLTDAQLWESAFTTAYDAFRTAADAVVLSLGYRVPATPGRPPHRDRHRARRAAVGHRRVRSRWRRAVPAGRHESEYFDPARPVDKTEADARWAVELASRAIDAVERALSAR